MPSDIEIQVEELHERRRKVRRTLTLIVFLTLLAGLALYYWQGPITGYAALETFETGNFIAGSSSDQSLSFEKVPNFIARPGERVKFRVNANKDNVWFSDNTNLFDITPEGTVDFTPNEGQTGEYNVWLIINDDAGRYYYQNVKIIIRE
ncbi:hypothetical protein KY363_03290 [Candidatus Woesearchaeota archaeon]|nr:hypothetical protein [Candidatus Woesearchaeota archaeon]